MPGTWEAGPGFPPLESPAHHPPISNSDGASTSNAQDLEHRLRNMIISNQPRLLDQESSRESEHAKQQNQSLHTKGATQEQQEEYLRSRVNARTRGSRGSLQQRTGPSHTDRRKRQDQVKPSNQPSATVIQSHTVDPQTSISAQIQPSSLHAVPPHLRGSSQEVQHEYTVRKEESSKTNGSYISTPRKRLNQAERRKQQMQQGQLGLLKQQSSSETTPSESEDSRIQAPFLPVPTSRANFTQHPPHRLQEASRVMQPSRVPYNMQSFHPQSSSQLHSPSQHKDGPERALHQTPIPHPTHRFPAVPKQQMEPGISSQSNRRFQDGFNNHRGANRQGTNQQYMRPAERYERPPVQQRRLYNPSQYSNFNANTRSQGAQLYVLPLADQVEYLDSLSKREIPKATMLASDLAAKDCIRRILENLCCDAVVNYERQKSKSFDASLVKLECFGSLSSGFATAGSDMDLALVSPESTPSTASLESEIPRLLEKVLLDCGYGARLLTRTRVPIIKFCESPTPELRDALLQERGKWEKSLLEPPNPRKKKMSEPTKGNTGLKVGDEKGDSDHGKKKGIRKPRSKKVNGAKVKSAEAATQYKPSATTASTLGTPLTAQEDEAVIEEKVERDTEATSEPNDDDDDASFDSDDDENPSRGKSEVSSAREKETEIVNEKDEKDGLHQPPSKYKAVMRSAKELIRLYRLAIAEDWFDKKERLVIFRFISAFEGNSLNPGHAELHETREALKDLPDVLSRYRDKPDDTLEFPKTGLGVQCDINFSNVLALHNTALLRCYSLCDPRIQQMAIFVKSWAKQRKINTPYRGTLSSYGYVLMVLHFVINIAFPPLAPNLQCHPYAFEPDVSNTHPNEVDGYNIRFWRDEQAIRKTAQQHNLLPQHNEESLGSLLRSFFCHFAQQGYHAPKGGFCWAQDVLSLRTEGGLLTKREKDWTGAKRTLIKATSPGQDDREIQHRYLFAIEDPFEVDHNIARTINHDGIVAIRDEFRRAYQITQRGGFGKDGSLVDLFEEGKELPSQRTYFGPKPRPFIGPINLAKVLRPKDPYGLNDQRGIAMEQVNQMDKGEIHTPMTTEDVNFRQGTSVGASEGGKVCDSKG